MIYETLTQSELDQLRACALGEEVPLGEIESRFQMLWDRDDAATRASLMNFAIYNEELGALLRNTGLIAEITREHACRALLIMCLPAKEEPRIRSWITAHCRLGPDGRKEACSEQVAFIVEGKSPDLIRNIVFGHLDSDLPLVLWWQGDFTDRFEEHLYTSIDRLFVDSDDISDRGAFYDVIVHAIENDRSRFTVHDLAWSRSYQFRLALATLFDEAAAREKIPSLRSLRLRHAPGHASTALLALAWLAAQSGWEAASPPNPSSASCAFALLDRQGEPVETSIEETADGAPLAGLDLEGHGFSLTIDREPAAPFLHASRNIDGDEHHQMFPAGSDEPAGLVTEQLMRGGNNRLFLKVLPFFRLLAQHGG